MENQAKAAKKRDAGQLDVGHYTSLSNGPLQETIVAFATMHPMVDVNLNGYSRTDLLAMLDRGSIDIAIMLGEATRRDFDHMSRGPTASWWLSPRVMCWPTGTSFTGPSSRMSVS
ncbi:MAG: hypothetical protein BGO16_10220 [Nitrobacter sp. 62-23]|nr:MAG: hypothetical protein BGO16_10220 [Nitrobacter sp. 62-23]